MTSKKVMFLLYSLNVGGAERRAMTLAGEMAARGVETQIVMLDNPGVAFDVDPRVKLVYLHKKGAAFDTANSKCPVDIVECPEDIKVSLADRLKLKWLSMADKQKHAVLDLQVFLEQRYTAMVRWYIKKHPDWLVVPWMSYCNVSTMNALRGLPNKAAFVECISPEAEFPGDHPMNTLKERYYPRANKAICQTPDQAAFYTFLPDVDIHVIPNPIRGEYPPRFEGERRRDIVNFCRLDTAKNLPLLMDAFALLAPEYPAYTLSIYGEGKLKEELQAYAEKLGLADRIRLMPFEMHIHETIRDAAMFVSSSDREGISNSMLEALAIGLPTICTDCYGGGARMIIRQRENGMIVPRRDPEAMKAAMKEVIDNPAFAANLSENAVKLRDELTVKAITDRWMAALDLEE